MNVNYSLSHFFKIINMKDFTVVIVFVIALLTPLTGLAVTDLAHQAIDLTTSNIGIASLIIFALAYVLVMAEEFTHLRKSKPVIIAAGVIWALIAFTYQSHPCREHIAGQAVRHFRRAISPCK